MREGDAGQGGGEGGPRPSRVAAVSRATIFQGRIRTPATAPHGRSGGCPRLRGAAQQWSLRAPYQRPPRPPRETTPTTPLPLPASLTQHGNCEGTAHCACTVQKLWMRRSKTFCGIGWSEVIKVVIFRLYLRHRCHVYCFEWEGIEGHFVQSANISKTV
jgi:hypothetical protein